jgi:hypothetical protein
MNKVKQALQQFWMVFLVPSKTSKEKPLSRQDVLMLLATNKLSTVQAKAVLAKRFQDK